MLAPPLNPQQFKHQYEELLYPNSNRSDLSPHLIHFTKGVESFDAFEMLIRILTEKKLRASTGFVKGCIPCVSFTEAPFGVLSEGFRNTSGTTRYSGFGFRFSKHHIFSLGGRPVIYQPDTEYKLLPPALRWRHVRFEPLAEPPVDWSWEREWRLACDTLPFSEREIEVVVPDDAAAERFRMRIEHDSFQNAWAWEVVLGEIAWMYHGPNPWRILRLEATMR